MIALLCVVIPGVLGWLLGFDLAARMALACAAFGVWLAYQVLTEWRNF